MDLTTIKLAYDSLKVAKDIFSAFNELKNEADAIGKINEAVRKVGEAQDTLFELRDELFRLQEENNNLKQIIASGDKWEMQLSKYKLVETEGGAVVYRSIKEPIHYICPSCVTKQEIHPLQDRRVISGVFDCPGCNKKFPVKKFSGSVGTVRPYRF
jgi:predicted nuclease with TOPRIM domain